MLWISGRPDGHRQGEWIAPDGVVIPYREWWQKDATAVIVYLHGQGDHSGPFTAMGDRLHELGLNVLAHDHRGFGLSQEPRGDIPSYEYFIRDAMEMIGYARRRNPGLPVFLVGLSMGGHIALRTAYRAAHDLQGVIALSPGLKLKTPPPWSLVIKGVFYALVQPRKYIAPVIHQVITTRNERHLLAADADEHWVRAYTARFHFGAVRSLRQARREVAELKIPVLIMQAGDDHLVCPEESRRFFERIRYPDKTFRLLEGLCHNLVAEPEMPEICQEILEWIRNRRDPTLPAFC